MKKERGPAHVRHMRMQKLFSYTLEVYAIPVDIVGTRTPTSDGNWRSPGKTRLQLGTETEKMSLLRF